MTGKPHWRPQASKKDKKLLRSLHLESSGCCLAGNDCSGRIELHHILGGAYGREDHTSNIVRICNGHHTLITANDMVARMRLGDHLLEQRLDVIAYVRDRLGHVSGDEWLRKRLFIDMEKHD